MEKKFSKEEIQETADFVQSTVSLVVVTGLRFLPVLKETLKSLEKRKSDVVSAAAILGPNYRIKELNLKFRIERLEGLIALLERYQKAEEIIVEMKKEKSGQDNMTKILNYM